MAESLQEKLNRAIDAMLAYGGSAPAASTDAELAPFARVAAELRELPSGNFKARLKADLIRRATTTPEALKAAVEPQPTVIPRLCFKDTRRAIEFYQRAFGAKEIMRLVDPDQRIGIAQIQIGNARILLSDEYPEFGAVSPETLGGSTVRIKLMVPDADATARRALAAGAKMVRPVQDQFYGERVGQIADPFGYTWIIATHKEDVSTEEMQRGLNEWNERSEGKMASNPAVSKTESGATGAAKAVPYMREGFHTITPYILVNGAAQFIEFMKNAFGAQERGRVPIPSGKIMHAEVRLGNSMIELSDGNEQYGPTPVALHYYVDDADAAYARALEAGAVSTHAPIDQPYGDREAGVKDPFGNHWFIATPKTYTPFPGQMNAIQPYLFLHDSAKMAPFLEQAFGAKAEGVHNAPDGTVAHATVRIGDNTLEFSEAHGEWQPLACHLHLYVPDTDAVYAQALRAGATSIEAPSDKPYGDRSAGVKDPWGNSWFIATHVKDVAF
ncbi:MAG: VOC family protein [Candidatus Acidiferrales bacterium]